jgi:protein-tyrosine phosphatase
MDCDNRLSLQALAGEELKQKVALFLPYATGAEDEVPDPYYGGTSGFERVLDLVEEASHAMLKALRARHSI